MMNFALPLAEAVKCVSSFLNTKAFSPLLPPQTQTHYLALLLSFLKSQVSLKIKFMQKNVLNGWHLVFTSFFWKILLNAEGKRTENVTKLFLWLKCGFRMVPLQNEEKIKCLWARLKVLNCHSFAVLTTCSVLISWTLSPRIKSMQYYGKNIEQIML